MKQLFTTVIFACVAIVAAASAGIVRPIEKYYDLDNLPNGEYPVAFNSSAITATSNGVYIDCEVFTLDEYDGNLLAELEAGDHVIAGDSFVVVTTVKKEKSYYTINEGEENELLLMRSKGGKYVVCGLSDQATYTSQGVKCLQVPVTATMVDAGIDGDPTATRKIEGKDIAKYLKNCDNDLYSELNTTITINNGKVTKINRTYLP